MNYEQNPGLLAALVNQRGEAKINKKHTHYVRINFYLLHYNKIEFLLRTKDSEVPTTPRDYSLRS